VSACAEAGLISNASVNKHIESSKNSITETIFLKLLFPSSIWFNEQISFMESNQFVSTA